MPKKTVNKALGLYSFQNELMLGDGALIQADNVVIDRDHIIEPRRGFNLYNPIGTDGSRAKQILQYKNRLLAHYEDKLCFEGSQGTFFDFDGTYEELEAGLRIKGTEANGNFYITTRDGIKKISITNSSQYGVNIIQNSGVPKALDLVLSCNYATPGFLEPNSVTAYRVLWGYKDNNGNLILGYPSPITVIRNIDASNSCTVDLTFAIPDEIISGLGYFYQIYRSPLVTPSTSTPEDEMNLVFEEFPTETDFTNGYVSTNDITPEDFRDGGALLYTNPISGEGISQGNSRPPIAKDLATFKGSLFFSNTISQHKYTTNLISLDDFISGSTKLIIGNEDQVTEYTFRGLPEISKLDFSTYSGTIPTDLVGNYFFINSASNARKYFVWFDTTGTDIVPTDIEVEGKLGLKVLVGIPEISKIDFTNYTGVIPTGLAGKYFFINSALDATEYFVWFDTTGLDVEPTDVEVTGKTAIKVLIKDYTTKVQAANAIATELSNLSAFNAVVNGPIYLSSTIVEVTNTANGATTAITDSTNNPVGGATSFLVYQAGSMTVDDVVDGIVDVLNDTNDFVALKNGPIYSDSKIIEVTNSVNGNTVDTTDSTNNPIANDSDFSVYQQGLGEDLLNLFILLSSQISVGQRIDETARSIINIINRNTNEIVTAEYISSVTDVPGQILFENKSLSDKPFYIAVNQSNISDNFSPELPVVNYAVPCSVIDPTTVRFTLASHGYIIGDTIVVYNQAGFVPSINGVHIITNKTATTFDVAFASTGSGTANVYKGNQVSDNEEMPNRLYFSKYQQPEAVPALNYIDIAAKDKPIKRIFGLRDALFILKTDGIYRLTGNDPSSFNVTLLDPSSLITAPDSATILNNRIYMLTTQGVVGVSDSGVSIISRNIEDKILEPTSINFPNFSTQSFGIASEVDRSYFLWLPQTSEDTVATQCYRYNIFTQCWTRWLLENTCGIIKDYDGKIYLGASDINYLEQERKLFNRTDYADREYEKTLLALSGTSITLSDLENIEVYDVIYQKQYITIARFNRLLRQLDNDPGLTFGLYEDTFLATNGCDLGTLLSDLIVQIDLDDTSQTYTSYTPSNDYLDLKLGFNTLIDELNLSSQVFYANYITYTELVEYENVIQDITESLNDVIITLATPFILGDITIFKQIDCVVQYAPDVLGDPGQFKQVNEAVLFFDQFNFSFGEVYFRTDLSDHFEGSIFYAEGNGTFGSQVYGMMVYGGNANQRAFRTLVARNKQRCNLIHLQFKHSVPREKFSINGYKYTFNQNVSRPTDNT